MVALTFAQWMISRFLCENNQLGRLARMIEGDSSFPKEEKDLRKIREYLISDQVDTSLMRAFNSACSKYGVYKNGRKRYA